MELKYTLAEENPQQLSGQDANDFLTGLITIITNLDEMDLQLEVTTEKGTLTVNGKTCRVSPTT